jgi:hypothetical protein
MVNRSLLLVIVNEFLSGLDGFVEHIVLGQHIHIHINKVTVENEVILWLEDFPVKCLKQLCDIRELLFVLHSAVNIIFVGLQLLLNKVFEVS